MLPIHFGLGPYTGHLLYATGVLVVLLTIFWRPVIGLYYLALLTPLQTVRYKMNDFPLGESVIYVLIAAVALGLLRKGRWFIPKTPWTLLLCFFICFTFLSMCMGSVIVGLPMPVSPGDRRLGEWADYMAMLSMVFLVAASVENKRQAMLLVFIMCLGTLALNKAFWNNVSGKDFSRYSHDLRYQGAMGYAGVNGLAAFAAQSATFLLALGAFERRRLLRWGYNGLAGFSAVVVAYSLSRAGYLAFLAGWLFIGLVKRRILLVLLAVFLVTWQGLVPEAVRTRATSSTNQETGELEHSAEVRVELWHEILSQVGPHMVLGKGFNTFAYTPHVYSYGDAHNYYLEVLSDTGIVGLALFLFLMAKTFWQGYKLSRRAKDPFLASLGLGLAGWLISSALANVFGDRWTFFQVNAYLWMLAGLVARAWKLEEGQPGGTREDESPETETEIAEEPAPA